MACCGDTSRMQLRLLLCAVCLAGCHDVDELVQPTVDDDPTIPAIEVNGTRLHSEAFGDPDAPLIIDLHGGPGSDYRGQVKLAALADDGFRVVFWFEILRCEASPRRARPAP